MKFEEAISAIKAGKRVRRSGWSDDPEKYMALYEDALIDQRDGSIFLFLSDVEADDWEILKEPKKVKLRDLTEEQYKEWRANNCPCPARIKLCNGNGCPFNQVRCYPDPEYNPWYLNKDIFNDKFLNQEVEVEE